MSGRQRCFPTRHSLVRCSKKRLLKTSPSQARGQSQVIKANMTKSLGSMGWETGYVIVNVTGVSEASSYSAAKRTSYVRSARSSLYAASSSFYAALKAIRISILSHCMDEVCMRQSFILSVISNLHGQLVGWAGRGVQLLFGRRHGGTRRRLSLCT